MGRQTLNVGVTFWWQLDKGGLGEKKKLLVFAWLPLYLSCEFIYLVCKFTCPTHCFSNSHCCCLFGWYQNAGCSHVDWKQQLSRIPQTFRGRVGQLRRSDLWTEQLLGSQPCYRKDSRCWTPQTMCVTQSNSSMFIPLNASREPWLMYKRITYSSVPNPVRPLCRRKIWG